MQRFLRGQVGECWVAKDYGKVSAVRRGSANQFGGFTHSHIALPNSWGVTELREAMTMWYSSSRKKSRSPCCLHHLKSYQGCGSVGNTTKNRGQSNLRGQLGISVNDFFWLLPVAFCNRDLHQLPNPPGFLGKNMPTLSS